MRRNTAHNIVLVVIIALMAIDAAIVQLFFIHRTLDAACEILGFDIVVVTIAANVIGRINRYYDAKLHSSTEPVRPS